MMYDDTKFKDMDTGEVWSFEELRKAYDQFGSEMEYDSFEDWFDTMLSLGRQGIGGMVEI